MKQNTIYRKILLNRELGKKMFAILIDPEKCNGRHLASMVAYLKISPPDFIFIGGSHISNSINNIIEVIKEEVDSSVVLFPGDASQFSDNADALLFLSLTSGRNPDYLIGQHIKSANIIKQSEVEVIPTGYILIEGGKLSSVEYISNTRAIPSDQIEIIKSTAIAGELLGMHLTYLEAGSGAIHPVSKDVIFRVHNSISTPLIVGGGIDSVEKMLNAFNAGADIVVIGNTFEKDFSKVSEFVNAVKSYNNKEEGTHNNNNNISYIHPDIIP